MFHWKILAPLSLNNSYCLMVPCDVCRVIFSYSKMSASTCMREQASSSWRSKMFSLQIQEFTRAQWWTALGRRQCLQSSLFKVQLRVCRGEKCEPPHSVKMSLVVFSIFKKKHSLLIIFSLSLPLFIKWCCGHLEHATAVNCVGSMGKKGNPSVCNRFL